MISCVVEKRTAVKPKILCQTLLLFQKIFAESSDTSNVLVDKSKFTDVPKQHENRHARSVDVVAVALQAIKPTRNGQKPGETAAPKICWKQLFYFFPEILIAWKCKTKNGKNNAKTFSTREDKSLKRWPHSSCRVTLNSHQQDVC